MQKKIWVIVASVAIIVAVYLLSKIYRPDLSTPSGKAVSSEYSPAQDPQQNSPSNPSPVTPRTTPARQAVPEAQRGNLSPAMATSKLEISTARDRPEFTVKEWTVRPSEIVSVTFKNDSDPALHYHHSFTLIQPNTEGKVGLDAAHAGPRNNFTPPSDEVIAQTRLLDAGQSETIIFRAPATAGDYPYICHYPGHGAIMKGVIHVR